MSGSDKPSIGRRIAGPLALVMLVAFFASLISNEVMNALLRDADIVDAIIHHRYFGLKYFEYLCDCVCFGSLTWMGTYYLFMGKWRWLSALAMALGLLACIGYGLHMLTIRSDGLRAVEALAHFPQSEEKMYRSILSDSNIPIKKRSSMSVTWAGMKYMRTGQPQSYLDTDDVFKAYVPGSNEVRAREENVATLAFWQIMSPRLLGAGTIFIVIGLISFLIGIVCARVDRTGGGTG